MSNQTVTDSNSSILNAKPLETLKEVEEWFKKVDNNNTGFLTLKSLQEALYWSQNKNFSKKACKLMMSLFDGDRNETINLDEFKRLCSYVNRWLHVFMMYDLNNSGTIDAKEFSYALIQMGYKLSNQFVELVMKVFGENSNEMTLDEFIMACVEIQKYTEAFRVRDLECIGTISLEYEDFLKIFLNGYV
ncbi:peflin-like [Onthophagus taurus]|uniref:peflin-like n=1 Tax=Onthophagus taurus TaxID=166361 RepID=UPI0039BDC261